jgi:hypothetical protein
MTTPMMLAHTDLWSPPLSALAIISLTASAAPAPDGVLKSVGNHARGGFAVVEEGQQADEQK